MSEECIQLKDLPMYVSGEIEVAISLIEDWYTRPAIKRLRELQKEVDKHWEIEQNECTE